MLRRSFSWLVIAAVLVTASHAGMAPPTYVGGSLFEVGSPVYVTKTGKKFHDSGCRHLDLSKREIHRAKAKKSGYTPCQQCRP